MAELNGFKMKSFVKILFLATIVVTVFEAECDDLGLMMKPFRAMNEVEKRESAIRDYLTVLDHIRTIEKQNGISKICKQINGILQKYKSWVEGIYLTE